ncbi:peptide ABC transporter substrate-binding protein [Ursidibacter sp. B-7004-1]
MKFTRIITIILALIPQLSFSAKIPDNIELAETQLLRYHYTNEVISIDPQKIETVNDRHLANQLFEGLVTSQPNGSVIPGVATHWEHSPDFKQWIFYLRQDAKWSNGENVTAKDFVYAWRRLADPKTASPYISYLSLLKLDNETDIIQGHKEVETLGIEAIDDYTIKLTLSAPVPYIDLLVQNPALFPVPKRIVEIFGDKWTAPENLVNNGAYSLQSRTINEKIELTRNPHYWDNQNSTINNVTIYILDSEPAFAHYRANQLDIANIPTHFHQHEKFRQEYAPHINTHLQLATYRYEINTTKPPLNDIRIRKALNLAIDRELITHKILGYDSHSTFTFTPNYIYLGHKIKQPEYANFTQAERNQQAKNLLKEAGYSKQNPITIELTHSNNKNLKHFVVTSKASWEKNLDGMVKINLKGLEWKTLLTEKQQGNFQLISASWFADYNEATTFLSFYHSKNHKNHTGFASEHFDNLLQQSYYTKETEQRAALYAQAEAELEKYQPFIAIYHFMDFFVKSPKLQGYDTSNPQGIFLIKDLYFVK